MKTETDWVHRAPHHRAEPVYITSLAEYRRRIYAHIESVKAGAAVRGTDAGLEVADALRRLSAEIRALAWFPRDNAAALAALADAAAVNLGDVRGPLPREEKP